MPRFTPAQRNAIDAELRVLYPNHVCGEDCRELGCTLDYAYESVAYDLEILKDRSR